jgi:UDP-glucose 4-epimerase
MNVLVTGGAGFIGSELVRQLAAKGSDVTVVDNLVNGRRENLIDLPQESVRLEAEDIRNTARMRVLMKDVHVFHLACLSVRHSIHALENHEVNATASLTFFGLRASGSSGLSVSQLRGLRPRSVPMTEDHPFPMTVYGAGKLAGGTMHVLIT